MAPAFFIIFTLILYVKALKCVHNLRVKFSSKQIMFGVLTAVDIQVISLCFRSHGGHVSNFERTYRFHLQVRSWRQKKQSLRKHWHIFTETHSITSRWDLNNNVRIELGFGTWWFSVPQEFLGILNITSLPVSKYVHGTCKGWLEEIKNEVKCMEWSSLNQNYFLKISQIFQYLLEIDR